MKTSVLSIYWRYLLTAKKENRIFWLENFLYSVRTFLEPLMLFVLWGAAAQISNITSVSSMALYFISLAVVARMTLTWIGGDLKKFIQRGTLFSHLMHPLPGGFLIERFLYELNLKYSRLKVALPVSMISYIVISQFVTIHWPSLSQLLFFPIAIIGGSIINYCLWLCITCSAFWLYSIQGIEDFVDTILPFFDGTFIPLVFLPLWLSNIIKWLPFRYNVSFPLEILTQNMSYQELLLGTGIMFFWCLALLLLSSYIWKKGLKAYQG